MERGEAVTGRKVLAAYAVGALPPITCAGGKEVWAGLVLLLFFGVLAAVAVWDWKTMEIPDCLSWGIMLLSLAMAAIGQNEVFWVPFSGRLAGFFSASFPMLLLALAVPGAFGGGDIKLMAACGVFLGWKLNLLALFFAVLAGGFWGIWLLAGGKAGRKDRFAFGPFLCMGILASFFWGEKILRWYCRAFW